MGEIPRLYLDRNGEPLRTVGKPAEGYVMVRRPGAMPRVIQVKELLNVRPHSWGPFTPVKKSKEIDK